MPFDGNEVKDWRRLGTLNEVWTIGLRALQDRAMGVIVMMTGMLSFAAFKGALFLRSESKVRLCMVMIYELFQL